MGTSRKHVQSALKVGDYVKVVNPRQIVRVGYPKGLNDYAKEICQDPEYGELVRRLNQFGNCNSWPVLEDRRGTTRRKENWRESFESWPICVAKVKDGAAMFARSITKTTPAFLVNGC